MNAHFLQHDIKVEMFLSDWIISFLCSYIPLDRLNEFFDQFFVLGWYSFHRMTLAILKFLEEEILLGYDMPMILTTLKVMKEHKEEGLGNIEHKILKHTLSVENLLEFQ